MANTETLIAQAYSAFNRRDVDSALALMSENVSWPHTCAIYPPISKPTTRTFWRSFSNSGLDAQWVYERTC